MPVLFLWPQLCRQGLGRRKFPLSLLGLMTGPKTKPQTSKTLIDSYFLSTESQVSSDRLDLSHIFIKG